MRGSHTKTMSMDVSKEDMSSLQSGKSHFIVDAMVFVDLVVPIKRWKRKGLTENRAT